MGDIDFENVCTICHNPVSRRPDKAASRVPNVDGGYDHIRCVEIAKSPSYGVFRTVFGDQEVASRERFAARAAGAVVGHEVKVIDGQWVCACGLRGGGEGLSKSAVRDEGLAHMRSAYALSKS